MNGIGRDVTPAGARAADTIAAAQATPGHIGGWVAIRLSDGASDGVVYDTRQAAVRHQLHETQCAYAQVPPTGFSAAEGTAFLSYHRKVYNAGHLLPDPQAYVPFNRGRTGR